MNGNHRTAKTAWKPLSEHQRRIKRESALRQRYGITKANYDAIFEKQKGLCAICGERPSGKRLQLFVDHCHQTNIVRGLLCSKCNSGLGYFNDRPQLLFAAASYLTEKHHNI